jgi:hypothetical protein
MTSEKSKVTPGALVQIRSVVDETLTGLYLIQEVRGDQVRLLQLWSFWAPAINGREIWTTSAAFEIFWGSLKDGQNRKLNDFRKAASSLPKPQNTQNEKFNDFKYLI